MKDKKKFIEDLFITCDKCGRNNERRRFELFGTCLYCGKVLDEKIYFKAQLRKKAYKTHKFIDKKPRAVLYF